MFAFCSFQNCGLYFWKTNYGKDKNWGERRNTTFGFLDDGNLNQCGRISFIVWGVKKNHSNTHYIYTGCRKPWSFSVFRWSLEELFRDLVFSFHHVNSGIQLQLDQQSWLKSHYALIQPILENKISFMIKWQNTATFRFEARNNRHVLRHMPQAYFSLHQFTYVDSERVINYDPY